MTDYRVLINCSANKGRSSGLELYCNYFTSIMQVPNLRFESAGVDFAGINNWRQ